MEIWDHWRLFFYTEVFPIKQIHQKKHGFCYPLIESLKGKTVPNGSDTEGEIQGITWILVSILIQ